MEIKTERLFYNDQYIKDFVANILEIQEKEDKFYVVLDKTAFFPGGGGQSCDLGLISGKKVIEVIEENKRIVHVMEEKPTNLNDVKCSIDWNRRKDGMDQHLAQHVLSGCFYSLLNANTAGIHLGNEISYVDIIGFILEEQIMQVEQRANEVVSENHKLEFIEVNRKKANKMGLRRQLATSDENIRVVKIQDLDINACCGVHPSSTLELQLIKIIASEKHKGNTRIYFKAGRRAVQGLLKRDKIFEELCKKLNTGEEDVTKTLVNMQISQKELKEENGKLKLSLAEYETKELVSQSEKISDIVLISKVYTKESLKFLNKLSNKLVENENRVVFFATTDNEKINMLFACSSNLKNLDMNSLLKDAISLIDGKGGGSKTLSQGAGKNLSNLENAMEYAKRRLNEAILT